MPKEHFGSTLELDEDVARDLQSLKKTLARYWRKTNSQTRTVFIETSFENDITRESHMVIDAVAVPDAGGSADEDPDDAPAYDFDLELVFQKTLLEAESEWK